ncbi:hypothetical protein NUACC21_48300 [Scytonema sp. NUACC21]
MSINTATTISEQESSSLDSINTLVEKYGFAAFDMDVNLEGILSEFFAYGLPNDIENGF